jgi:hypothetical protein
MKYVCLSVLAIFIGATAWSAADGGRRLALRSRVELFRGSDQWNEVSVDFPLTRPRVR